MTSASGCVEADAVRNPTRVGAAQRCWRPARYGVKKNDLNNGDLTISISEHAKIGDCIARVSAPTACVAGGQWPGPLI